MFQIGILCNWWRNSRVITPAQVMDRLTERNLEWHLNHYNDPDPLTMNAPFSENTPFISTTAGAVERDDFARSNILFDPFIIALRFATSDFTTEGHVFYLYLFTLGRQSIPLVEFSEEVRELNIYKDFLPYHHEGEITAKITIRSRQIEKWEKYDGPSAMRALQRGNTPRPVVTRTNLFYSAPERYCNIRGLVTE